MPWWIWLLLVIFMLVMLVAGLAYAAFRLWKGVQKIGGTGAAIGERFDAMGRKDEPKPDEPPLFTQPLSVASDRYAEAHAQVLRRKAAKRARHITAWERWRRFND